MFKFKASTLIAFSGVIWLAVGINLLSLGLNFLIASAGVDQGGPLLSLVAPSLLSYENGALLLITLAIMLGFVKARMIFSKTVQRSIERILTFTPPISIIKMYSARYFLVLGLMIGLGVSFKFFGFALDARGFVDVTVGSALTHGASAYFRQFLAVRQNEQELLKKPL